MTDTRIFHSLVFAAFGCGLWTASAFAASPACPSDAPVAEVQGVEFYADKKASIADSKKQAEDAALYRPVQMFVLRLSEFVDRENPSDADFHCVQEMIVRWATARALLREPTNFEAVRERARFAIGLNVVALKMRAARHPLDAVALGWLQAVSRASAYDFRTRAERSGWIDNLYVWSGVDAASSAALTPDAELRAYATTVWRRGLAQVASDGSVKSELARGGRALIYHQYYLAGLLMLRAYRVELGDEATAPELDALKRLARFVSDATCDPQNLKIEAGGADQEKPPAYQNAVPAAFAGGMLDKRWRQCAAPPDKLIDAGFGGDMDKAAAALRH